MNDQTLLINDLRLLQHANNNYAVTNKVKPCILSFSYFSSPVFFVALMTDF